ncbi:MAG: zinc-binding dehydrogenase, partial [Rubrivivax sp.]
MSGAARQARAVVARGVGAPVGVETIRVDPPRTGEVTLRIEACGVCHSDLSATNGTIPFPLPMVLGHEAAGVVVEVGAGVDGFTVGDRVISSFVSMCGHCRWCVSGRPQLCDQASKAMTSLPDGSVRSFDAQGNPLAVFSGCGVMAEFATLHIGNVVPSAADISPECCALISCGVMTGVGAVLNTARVEAGSTAIVFGAGGVGLNAIQGCAIAGAAMIVAVDRIDAKLELARVFGATHTVNSTGDEQLVRTLKALTGGGADFAFECVGHGSIVAQAYGALRKGGTAVVVGVAGAKDQTTLRTASLTFEEKTL